MRPADEHYINAIRNNDRKGLHQDALIVIFKKVQEADFQLTSGFYTLLYGICRNLWGNRLQKKSGNEVSIPEDYKYTGEAGLSQLLEQQEEEQLFWDAFRQLGQDCQQLLQWFFAKVKMAEIAERMEYSSVGYAKKRKFQCKEQLIQRVKADARYSELMNK